jgi:hypothetical protein
MPVQVGGFDGYYSPIMPGDALQPTLLLTDDMLYIATGKALLERLLAGTEEDGATSVKDILSAASIKEMENANSQVFLMRPNRLASELEGLLDWALLMAGQTGTIANPEQGRMVGEAILKVIGSVESVTMAANNNGTAITYDSMTKMMPKETTEVAEPQAQ